MCQASLDSDRGHGNMFISGNIPEFGAVIKTPNKAYLKMYLVQLLSVHQSTLRGQASLHLISPSNSTPPSPKSLHVGASFSILPSRCLYLQNQHIITEISILKIPEWKNGIPFLRGCKMIDLQTAIELGPSGRSCTV